METQTKMAPLQSFVFRETGAIRATDQPDTTEAVRLREEAVNKYSLRPLTPNEYAVITIDVAHNQITRHFSRFTSEDLVKLKMLLPGIPLFEKIDTHGKIPRGRIFRAALHRSEEMDSVTVEAYVLRTSENSDFILKIEGGMYNSASLGFAFKTPTCSICAHDIRTCDHIPGRIYEEDHCYFIMNGLIEVTECNIDPYN